MTEHNTELNHNEPPSNPPANSPIDEATSLFAHGLLALTREGIVLWDHGMKPVTTTITIEATADGIRLLGRNLDLTVSNDFTDRLHKHLNNSTEPIEISKAYA